MSAPKPGNYFIVNKVNSASGQPLALNYDGVNQDVTVIKLGASPTQVWVVSDYGDGKTQSVSPQTATDLQIGKGDGVLKTLPASEYVWTIRQAENVYTVQDGAQSDFWGLPAPIEGAPVSLGPGTGSETQTWEFIHA